METRLEFQNTGGFPSLQSGMGDWFKTHFALTSNPISFVLIGLLIYIFFSKSLQIKMKPILSLFLFSVLSLPLIYLLGRPIAELRIMSYVPTIMTALGLFIIFIFAQPIIRFIQNHRHFKYSLVLIPLSSLLIASPPTHVAPKNFSLATQKLDAILEGKLWHHKTKNWISNSLPIQSNILWSHDNQLYYQIQKPLVLRNTGKFSFFSHSSIEPNDRFLLLCKNGIQYWAHETEHSNVVLQENASYLKNLKILPINDRSETKDSGNSDHIEIFNFSTLCIT